MEVSEFQALRKSVQTAAGDVAYAEQGRGPVALFVHGILMHGAIWRHVIEKVSDQRRCVAVDILGHGGTPARRDQDLSFQANAGMLEAFCAAMGFDQVDLVANDSGGGIAQIFAAQHPGRIRTLTLTNCDAHDNYPPAALEGFMTLARNGQIGATLRQLAENHDAARQVLSSALAHPDEISDATLDGYLRPWLVNDEAARILERFMLAMDNAQNVRIEPNLRQLRAPTLIVWATDDVFFDKKWAYWLKDVIPGATKVIELPGEKLFFPEERPELLAEPLLEHWSAKVPA
jgi:pimeloyl-ACP methyl ester carboxylesterase